MAADPRTPDRVAGCGWWTAHGRAEIRQRDASVYVAQLIVCARPWAEPVCSAKIRARKGTELQQLIAALTAAGGAVSFGVLTCGEHHSADPLERSLTVLRGAWAKLTRCERYDRMRDRCGIIGTGLNYETTWGTENGWHPHLNALWFHRAPLGAAGITDLCSTVLQRWQLAIGGAGRYLHPSHGVKIFPNAAGPELAGYVTKVQEGDWTIAQEITRGDVKRARAEHGQTPFDMLWQHYRTGDLADWQRFGEFTAAMLLGGNRSIPIFRLSPGTRGRILGAAAAPAPTDEQLAVVEVGGELICTLAWRVWVRVRQSRAVPDLLAAGERGGMCAINDLLAERGLGWADPPSVNMIREV